MILMAKLYEDVKIKLIVFLLFDIQVFEFSQKCSHIRDHRIRIKSQKDIRPPSCNKIRRQWNSAFKIMMKKRFSIHTSILSLSIWIMQYLLKFTFLKENYDGMCFTKTRWQMKEVEDTGPREWGCNASQKRRKEIPRKERKFPEWLWREVPLVQ